MYLRNNQLTYVVPYAVHRRTAIRLFAWFVVCSVCLVPVPEHWQTSPTCTEYRGKDHRGPTETRL